MAGGNAYVALGHAEIIGEEIDQRRVRLALHGRRSEPQLEAPAVLAGELRARRSGLPTTNSRFGVADWITRTIS